MKNNLRKGFTMIELLVVIAIVGILAGTVIPKLIKEIRKATVAKVQHNLGVIRSRLSLDETFLDEFPNLYDETNTTLLDNYRILDTPGFTDSDGDSHEASSDVVYTRTNIGGWLYNIDEGEMYANLPNGAYTKDSEYEIWSGETTITPEITYNASENILPYGRLQFYNEETDGWEDMVDGDVYSSDTKIKYVPNADGVSNNSNKIDVGTISGATASLTDWGDISGDNNNIATTTIDGVTVTTTLENGSLATFNEDKSSSQGTGIGSTNLTSGLNKNNSLTIDVDGEDINKVVFTLDGLGNWFDGDSSKATKVTITAYDDDGDILTEQSGYRDSGEFSDDYTFEVADTNISYFVLSSESGKDGSSGSGTYVVQSVSLIRSAQDYVSLTVENPDGTTDEITKEILLDDTNSHEDIIINGETDDD